MDGGSSAPDTAEEKDREQYKNLLNATKKVLTFYFPQDNVTVVENDPSSNDNNDNSSDNDKEDKTVKKSTSSSSSGSDVTSRANEFQLPPLPFLQIDQKEANNMNNTNTNIQVDEHTPLLGMFYPLLRLAAPVALTQFLRTSMSIFTSYVAGNYLNLVEFAAVMTGVGFVSITALNIGSGFCAVMDTLVTQAYGKEKNSPVLLKILFRSLIWTFLAYAPFFFLFFFSGYFLPFIIHEELVEPTAFFLKFSFLIIVPMLIINNLIKFSQCQHVTQLGLLGALVGFITLVPILLLLRHLRTLGIILGLAINRTLILLVVIFYMVRHPDLKKCWTPPELVEELEQPSTQSLGNSIHVLVHEERNGYQEDEDENENEDAVRPLDGTEVVAPEEDQTFVNLTPQKQRKTKTAKVKKIVALEQLRLIWIEFKESLSEVHDFLEFGKSSLPVLASFVADSWTFELMTILSSNLSPLTSATWGVVMVIYNQLFSLFYGTASGGAIRIGTAVGERRGLLARRYTVAFTLLNMLLSFLVVLFCWFGGTTAIFHVIQKNEEVRAEGASVRILIGCTFWGDSLFYALQGAFRGIGRNRELLGIVLLSMWGVTLPLALVLTKGSGRSGASYGHVGHSGVREMLLALCVGVNVAYPLQMLYLALCVKWETLS